MADEHSFDIVSRVDMQEVTNAVQQSVKEIQQRFDFKGSKSSIELNKEAAEITLVSDDEYKLKSLIEILKAKLVKRNVSLKSLGYGTVEKAAGDTVRQVVTLQQGLSMERSKKYREAHKRDQAEGTGGDPERPGAGEGEKIDDLQTVMQMLKGKDFDFHVEFINYR